MNLLLYTLTVNALLNESAALYILLNEWFPLECVECIEGVVLNAIEFHMLSFARYIKYLYIRVIFHHWIHALNEEQLNTETMC